jgi:hypothetical protein
VPEKELGKGFDVSDPIGDRRAAGSESTVDGSLAGVTRLRSSGRDYRKVAKAAIGMGDRRETKERVLASHRALQPRQSFNLLLAVSVVRTIMRLASPSWAWRPADARPQR